MEWYYAKDKAQQGPVDQSHLKALFDAGEINASTLVWRAGMAAWEPYGKAFNSSQRLLADGQTGQACNRCGKFFSAGDLIKFNGLMICAGCKPYFFQEFKETGTISINNLWRSGKILVMNPEGKLPDFCVKCNAPAHGQQLTRKLFWHNPLIYILIFINVLLYAIVASLAGKKATIQIGLCDTHKKKRLKAIGCGWGSFALGIMTMIVAGMEESWGIFFVGLLVLIVGSLVGISKSSLVSARKITPEHLFIKGICPEYLDKLPEWPGDI